MTEGGSSARAGLGSRARLVLGMLGAVVMIGAGIGAYLSIEPGQEQRSQPSEGSPFRMHAEPRNLPDVAFEDAGGKKVTLADFRGKVVLLNLWATWCPPCRAEMPSLDRLQQQLGGKGFEVVALSLDVGGAPLIKSFYAETGVTALAIYIDRSMQTNAALGAPGLPTTLLIDAQGREIGRKVGPAEWDSPEIVASIRRHLAPEPESAARGEKTPPS